MSIHRRTRASHALASRSSDIARSGARLPSAHRGRSLAERTRAERDVVLLSPVRSRAVLPLAALTATIGLLLVSMVDPYSGAYAAETNAPADPRAAQTYTSAGEMTAMARDGYGLTKPAPPPPPSAAATSTKGGSASAPVAGTPDPGTAQAIAKEMLAQRGWGDDQFDCLVALWNKESHWNVYAANKSSGAYGIPQALPGSKMASAGADWQTNPATQITWGLGYVSGRYQTPCGAWGHSQSRGWY